MKKGKRQVKSRSVARRYVSALTILSVLIFPSFSCYGQDVARAKTDQGFSYDPTGKIDPFKPFIQPKKAQEEAKERARTTPLTPLEKYPVTDLKLVAIAATEDGKKIAMVEDREGKFYPIATGTPIGINEGQVSRIEDNQVVIVEDIRDFEGKHTTKQTIMKLKEMSEE